MRAGRGGCAAQGSAGSRGGAPGVVRAHAGRRPQRLHDAQKLGPAAVVVVPSRPLCAALKELKVVGRLWKGLGAHLLQQVSKDAAHGPDVNLLIVFNFGHIIGREGSLIVHGKLWRAVPARLNHAREPAGPRAALGILRDGQSHVGKLDLKQVRGGGICLHCGSQCLSLLLQRCTGGVRGSRRCRLCCPLQQAFIVEEVVGLNVAVQDARAVHGAHCRKHLQQRVLQLLRREPGASEEALLQVAVHPLHNKVGLTHVGQAAASGARAPHWQAPASGSRRVAADMLQADHAGVAPQRAHGPQLTKDLLGGVRQGELRIKGGHHEPLDGALCTMAIRGQRHLAKGALAQGTL